MSREQKGWLKEIKFSQLSLTDLREFMYFALRESPAAGQFWDLITGLRGPDSPSERPDMSSEESAKAYAGRRNRKYDAGEVIRDTAFFGACGGCARSHAGDTIVVNPASKQDHYDRHAVRAAKVIGLKVKERE